MNIKILGTGCPKCQALEERVRKVTEANQIDAEIEKVTDINDIMSYGIMMTPGLVINGKVRAVGKVPGEEQILAWLK